MSAAERKSSAGGASLLARLRRHYRFHFTEPRRERLFLASVGFGAGGVEAVCCRLLHGGPS